jgi:hypothetical protein
MYCYLLVSLAITNVVVEVEAVDAVAINNKVMEEGITMVMMMDRDFPEHNHMVVTVDINNLNEAIIATIVATNSRITVITMVIMVANNKVDMVNSNNTIKTIIKAADMANNNKAMVEVGITVVITTNMVETEAVAAINSKAMVETVEEDMETIEAVVVAVAIIKLVD